LSHAGESPRARFHPGTKSIRSQSLLLLQVPADVVDQIIRQRFRKQGPISRFPGGDIPTKRKILRMRRQ
jgi:hypothetical protein